MKLESFVNGVFLYQNMHFLHAKLSTAAAIAAAKKLSEKRWNFENELFSIDKIKKFKKFYLESKFLIPKF